MREFAALSRNLLLLPKDQGDAQLPLAALVEVALVVSEVKHEYVGPSLLPKRTLETLRFVIDPEQLRRVAKTLTEYADDADKSLTIVNKAAEAFDKTGGGA